ncbi:type 2 isopentenyl-diphosphate Delta-isomerase [archaeon SCG-AAA382B04]|nr:type 2 isopentenyl-diphosphate Delta-isomerase [archaeon SCG-AAA382B04]
MTIKNRKLEHIAICKNYDIEKNETLLGDIKLLHNAVPEINKNSIDTETTFLDKKIDFPFIIPAITGGHPDLIEINKRLAKAAEEIKIGIGVGSQRAAIENPELEKSLKIVKEKAPNALKIANLGAPQLSKGYGVKEAKKAIEMIDADSLAIHLNFLQEAIQLEGDTEAKDVLGTIKKIKNKIKEPVIVKETGQGITRETAKKLKKTNIDAIDVSGIGGTSWPLVEKIRANNENIQRKKKLGDLFSSWGIPTAASIIEANIGPQIMASGGIRNGIDIAKSVVLGADCTGAATPLLEPATEDLESLKNKIKLFKEEFRLAMFLTGSKNIKQLKNTQFVLKGRLKNWTTQRNIEINR